MEVGVAGGRMGMRVALLAALALAVVLLFIIVVVRYDEFSATEMAGWFLAILIVTLGAAYLRLSFVAYVQDDPFPKEHVTDQVTQIDEDDVETLVASDGSSILSSEQVVVFAGCIVAPKHYFLRITEHLESYHRSTLVRSTFSLRVRDIGEVASEDALSQTEAGAGLGHVIPLYLPNKTALQDGIRVHDHRGQRVSTLDSATQNIYSAAVIRFLISIVSQAALDEYLANGRAIEKAVWGVMESSAPSRSQTTSAVDAVLRLDSGSKRKDLLGVVANLIRELATRRPISVAVSTEELNGLDWPSTLRFTLDRRFIAPTEPAPTALQRSNRALDSVRLALGVRLLRVYFPL